MKTLILSDHTGDQVSAAVAAREAEYAKAAKAYQIALASRKTLINSRRHAISVAWGNRKLLSTVAAIISLGSAHLSSKPSVPTRKAASREEIVWASGHEGEQRVMEHLSRLPDEWVLVSGYRNAKGEIDQILLGPSGIFAIEIKFINGVVHCDGDRWWSDKYDRYGNLVETGKPLADKRGRGPSKQVNESADLLQSFLAKHANITQVQRVIVLAHTRSRLGELNNLAVDAVTTIDAFDLGRLFSLSSTKLDAQAVDQVLQAIRKGHAFFNRPRSQRTKTAPLSEITTR